MGPNEAFGFVWALREFFLYLRTFFILTKSYFRYIGRPRQAGTRDADISSASYHMYPPTRLWGTG
jgi:hypothetical protein